MCEVYALTCFSGGYSFLEFELEAMLLMVAFVYIFVCFPPIYIIDIKYQNLILWKKWIIIYDHAHQSRALSSY